MSASDLVVRPIPQFGSLADGRYDVVCLWERRGADTMSAALRDLGLDTQSVIVFYLGRLTTRQRLDATRNASRRERALALLDETLLVFLSGERDERLPIFLRCALPSAALNPYMPFQAGNVPPEIFFGREAMITALQRPAGGCLVYGGRQLGKSALLYQVKRESHHPEREQYAWVEDIKLIGDPQAGQPPHTLCWRLRESFKRLGLLSSRQNSNKPEEIQRYILNALRQKPERRVLVLFDEADNFLDADARDRFQVVEFLRTLMLNTAGRFKVVFAGLHNVQRFHGIPNQPLAHFGRPMLIGPLEPKAAQNLIREPFEVLGYRFADDAAVLRILSYTNYHPGLIQLFCQELLKQLHAHVRTTLPPYDIEQRDVEAVYRKAEVYNSILDRFNWTLALDMHYQTIAWAMIEDQMEARDRYAQAYSPGDILQLARYWWPQGFNNVGQDELRGLLDEMCGLGVLVRSTEGPYRIRSPNLVRLMGTEFDIRDKLLDLSGKQPPAVFDADSHHAPLDPEARRYSPLTYAQGRNLNQPRYGVGLAFASQALGLSFLPEAFKRFIPSDLLEDIRADCTQMPSGLIGSDEMEGWLQQYLREHDGYERLVVYTLFNGAAARVGEQIAAALSVCHRHEKRSAPVAPSAVPLRPRGDMGLAVLNAANPSCDRGSRGRGDMFPPVEHPWCPAKVGSAR